MAPLDGLLNIINSPAPPQLVESMFDASLGLGHHLVHIVRPGLLPSATIPKSEDVRTQGNFGLSDFSQLVHRYGTSGRLLRTGCHQATAVQGDSGGSAR